MNNRLRVHHVIAAAVVLALGLAGCSSTSGSTAQSATTPASTPASTASSTPDAAATTSGDAATSASSAAATTSSAGGAARPADACPMLSSDQVASAVGTPGPYNESHEDPRDDGTPVWGCTWGTRSSSADIREIPASSFLSTPDPADITTAPVSGIGDQARLETMTPDGRNPEILFTVGGAYYNLSVTVDRSETGAANADQEKSAEQTLAKLLAAKLAS